MQGIHMQGAGLRPIGEVNAKQAGTLSGPTAPPPGILLRAAERVERQLEAHAQFAETLNDVNIRLFELLRIVCGDMWLDGALAERRTSENEPCIAIPDFDRSDMILALFTSMNLNDYMLDNRRDQARFTLHVLEMALKHLHADG